MTAGHFIFIPAVLLIGVVIGWVILSITAGVDGLRSRSSRQDTKRVTGGEVETISSQTSAKQAGITTREMKAMSHHVDAFHNRSWNA